MPVVSGLCRTIYCTVTCRQFYKLDIRSTENLRIPAATSRFNAIKVTTCESIHEKCRYCKDYFKKSYLHKCQALVHYCTSVRHLFINTKNETVSE